MANPNPNVDWAMNNFLLLQSLVASRRKLRKALGKMQRGEKSHLINLRRVVQDWMES